MWDFINNFWRSDKIQRHCLFLQKEKSNLLRRALLRHIKFGFFIEVFHVIFLKSETQFLGWLIKVSYYCFLFFLAYIFILFFVNFYILFSLLLLLLFPKYSPYSTYSLTVFSFRHSCIIFYLSSIASSHICTLFHPSLPSFWPVYTPSKRYISWSSSIINTSLTSVSYSFCFQNSEPHPNNLY